MAQVGCKGTHCVPLLSDQSVVDTPLQLAQPLIVEALARLSKESNGTHEALGVRLQRELRGPTIPSYIPGGDAPAIFDNQGKSINYNQLRNWLQTVDIHNPLRITGPKSRVAVCIENGPYLATALVATASTCCCAPMDKNGAEAEFERDFKLLGCTAVLVDSLDAPASRAATSCGLPCALLVPETTDCATFTLKVISTGSVNEGNVPPHRCSTGPSDTVLVLCTSGTTGNKKVVPYTMETIVIGAGCIMESWALTNTDRCLNMMPLMHVGGILRNLMAVLFSGGSTICCPFFDAQMWWSCLKLDATWYYASPTMHRAILEERTPGQTGPHRGHKLRMICNAAGGLNSQLAKELRQCFSCSILPSYGMTECMPISSPPPDFDCEAPTTSGLPCGPEVKIVGTEGEFLPPNTRGNIVVRGPPVMLGYEGNLSATEASFWPPGGWFSTGDMGYLDEGGWLYVTGRTKEVINRGGETISPAEIEDVTTKHPDILASAAFAIGDHQLEENVGLAVVSKDPSCRIGLPRLHQYLKDHLRPSCWPQAIVYLDKLPKTSTGKVRRGWITQALDGTKISNDEPWRQRLFQATVTGCTTVAEFKMQMSKVEVSDASANAALSTLVSSAKTILLPTRKQPLVSYTTPPLRTKDQIKDAVKSLHEYDQPDAVVQLEELPLGPAFPEPTPSDYLNGVDYKAPATQEEKAVCEAWAQILSLDENSISVEADFFQLGGTSLLCGRVANHLRLAFPCNLPTQVVFANPRLKDLANAVAAARDDDTAGSTTTGLTPSASMDSFELPTEAKDLIKHYSCTRPIALVVQLIPFLVFPALFHIGRFLVFIFSYHWLRANGIFEPYSSTIDKPLHGLIPEFLICWYTAMLILPWIISVILPLIGIAIKWSVIGRFKPGKYPVWGSMYLRWWFVRKSLAFCRPGIFEQSDRLYRIYLRMLGAKVDSSSMMSCRCSDFFCEADLLTVEEEVVVSEAHLACAIVDNGFLELGPIMLERKSSVGQGTILTPGTTVLAGMCLGPGTSSLEMHSDSNDKMRQFNSMNFTKPSKITKWIFGYPLVFIVHFISNLPYLYVIYWMVHYRPGSLTWSTARYAWMRQAVDALTYPERIYLWIVALIVHGTVCPMIHAVLLILTKKFIIGRFVPMRKEDETEWHRFRLWLIRSLCTQKFMMRFSRLVGPHWSGMTWFYRSMGMRCGDRIFWPGTPIEISQFDLIEIGNDVVFGSRSHITCEDQKCYAPVRIEDGAMLADRCLMLPGTRLGRNAMLGSGTVAHKDESFPNNSIWVGNVKNAAVQLASGDGKTDEEPTKRPFGEAFQDGKVDYCLIPAPLMATLGVLFQMATMWLQPAHGWMCFLAIRFLNCQWHGRGRFVLICIGLFLCIHIILQVVFVSLDIFSKWAIIGRRTQGTFNWTNSSYNQRWKLHLSLQHALHRTTHREPYLELLGGSFWLVLYYRLMGATIGKNVCLYPMGGWPMMTEPDLVTIGDNACVGYCSLVCHSNTQGNFEINPIKVGQRATIRDRTRLSGGAEMRDGSTLLEHTLVVPGDCVPEGAQWQGWPVHTFKRSNTKISMKKSHDSPV